MSNCFSPECVGNAYNGWRQRATVAEAIQIYNCLYLNISRSASFKCLIRIQLETFYFYFLSDLSLFSGNACKPASDVSSASYDRMAASYISDLFTVQQFLVYLILSFFVLLRRMVTISLYSFQHFCLVKFRFNKIHSIWVFIHISMLFQLEKGLGLFELARCTYWLSSRRGCGLICCTFPLNIWWKYKQRKVWNHSLHFT